MSMKLNQMWLRILAVVVIALIVGLVVWNIAHPGEPQAAGAVTAVEPVKLKTGEERTAFIRSYGWEVSDAAVEVAEVEVPKPLDEFFRAYAELQKSHGLDLEKYEGKKLVRWSYEVLNYPVEDLAVRVNLYLYKDKLAACDVSSTDGEGFMHSILNMNT
ncbi:MAG TPA: DUF4830 domain-containing protein [Terriglobales bacterium]|nr:DUF4830 domain-containing protein [Terriglobales bacterium]